MRRSTYIAWRAASDMVSLLSRAMNAFLFGGSTAQTTSARAHLEAPGSVVWARRRRWINRLFFWQADHCADAFQAEVVRARYVLRVLSDDAR